MKRTSAAFVVLGLTLGVSGMAGCGGPGSGAAAGPTPSAVSSLAVDPSAASPTTSPAPSGGPLTGPSTAVVGPRGTPSTVILTHGSTTLVDAKLVPTRLDAHGVLAPPKGVAGWYAEPGWPKPGFPGASILVGHINSRADGPDTFAELPQARAGDLVTVTYGSGDVVRFRVVRSAAVPKTQTPKDDSIWDAGAPGPLVRLITCDPTTPLNGGHFEGNWVVWADPVAPG